MYNINNVFYLKLLDRRVNSYVDYFYTIQEIIEYMSYKFYTKVAPNNKYEIHNIFVEQCACHPNEQNTNPERCYQLFDNKDRIINPRDFWEDALELRLSRGDTCNNAPIFELKFGKYRRAKKVPPHIRRHKSVWKFLFKQKHNARFRIDPVPNTGHYFKYGILFRQPRTYNQLKVWANVDMKPFNRKSRNDIPTAWDDRYRRSQRSWKKQSKARHQWQRGII